MAGLVRLTTTWSGFPGAPGYTNFYAHHNGVSAQEVANAFADDIYDFWNTVNGSIPNDVTLTVGPTWQSVDIGSGDVVAEGTVETPPADVDGTAAVGYAGNVGVCINWQTGTFIAGRRLRGRTYLVPASALFELDGTIYAPSRTAILEAATTLLEGSSNMVVWHRPVGGAGGSYAQITNATMSDRPAILRSRGI